MQADTREGAVLCKGDMRLTIGIMPGQQRQRVRGPECGDSGTAPARGVICRFTPGYWKSSVPTAGALYVAAGVTCRCCQTAKRIAWSAAEARALGRRALRAGCRELVVMAIVEIELFGLMVGQDCTAIVLGWNYLR